MAISPATPLFSVNINLQKKDDSIYSERGLSKVTCSFLCCSSKALPLAKVAIRFLGILDPSFSEFSKTYEHVNYPFSHIC
jgi:hypothetical protein